MHKYILKICSVMTLGFVSFAYANVFESGKIQETDHRTLIKQYKLFKKSNPFHTGYLEVSPLHKLYYA